MSTHATSPIERNLALVRAFYDDMWNRFDPTVLPTVVTPDVRFRGSLGDEVIGFDGLAAYVERVRAFAPDFHNEIVTTISEGDRTFARLRYTGTHRGEVFGLAPTGREFQYAGAAVFTFAGDRISDVWVLGDLDSLLRQLA